MSRDDSDANDDETRSADDDAVQDDDGEERQFFLSRSFTCRDDIVKAVVEYNHHHGRAYHVLTSDHRRYRAICVDQECGFVVAFAYGRAFGPPSVVRPHTCDPTKVDLHGFLAGRADRPTHLIKLDAVRQFVINNGRGASPADLQRLLARDGRSVSYQTCVDVCNRLKAKLFEEDRLQYQLIESYVDQLIHHGHRALLELNDKVVSRVVVVYKQGVQVLGVFADRGISIDGTFMKHELRGTLLVACLRNSNNEIQVVAVAWVSGETKENWSWFVKFLFQTTNQPPAFVISDRDKGLIPAMEKETSTTPHFFCVRHMLENFNAKFHSQPLRDLAWKLAKSLSQSSFTKRSSELELLNASALAWMTAVEKTKWSAAHSPCARFGTMTSNNVESINSVFLSARAKPLLDCLMHVEQYVGVKWVECVNKASSWKYLTAYAQKKFVRERLTAGADKIEIIPSCSSSFVAKVAKDGELPVEYAVDLDDRASPCSCGYFAYMRAPCAHVIAALRSINRLSKLESFFDASWTTESYKRAYDPSLKMKPYVIKDDLLRKEDHVPPPVPKKRGRPKKSTKRIESQPATKDLKKKAAYACTVCGGSGHNKRSCSKK